MRVEIQRSSLRLRSCKSRALAWFCERSSTRWTRAWRRIRTLRAKIDDATATRVTSVPKTISLPLRLWSRGKRRAKRSSAMGAKVLVLERDGQRDLGAASRLDGHHAADRPRPLVPAGDRVAAGRNPGDREATFGVWL